MEKFDVVVIGSGMGGLVCADILGKEGYRVCVIEKNKQIGGCLQTYVRNKVIFDSGVHYLGGLAPGQNMYQIFKYLGILDNLKLQQLDEGVFDKILIGGDEKEYVHAQGYERFIENLLKDFPNDETAIRLYCDKIRETCDKFPLYNLRPGGNISEKAALLEIDTKEFIDSITSNEKLKAVLLGSSMLYVLQPNKTPFYVHAMILNSYIESSWKCVDGGSVIGKLMARNIRAQGGEILRNKEVDKIIVEDGRVTKVRLKDGGFIYGDQFISNMHPVRTLEMTDTDIIKQAYRNRVKSMENSVGGFVLNIVLKKGAMKYVKNNYYYHDPNHTWNLVDYTEENWPLCYAIFFGASSRSGDDADSISILTYMRYDDVKQWGNTFNTISSEASRGEDYEQFKERKAERLLDLVEEKFPGLRDKIAHYYTATPLSYKDYIGNDDGSMYGIVKDYQNPLKTFLSPKTKVPNLFLTGQNLNLHGILGTAMSGIVTCISLLGSEKIVEKIRNA